MSEEEERDLDKPLKHQQEDERETATTPKPPLIPSRIALNDSNDAQTTDKSSQSPGTPVTAHDKDTSESDHSNVVTEVKYSIIIYIKR